MMLQYPHVQTDITHSVEKPVSQGRTRVSYWRKVAWLFEKSATTNMAFEERWGLVW